MDEKLVETGVDENGVFKIFYGFFKCYRDGTVYRFSIDGKLRKCRF